jgi:hypothetical protein
MGSLPEPRYCALGRQCAQYSALGNKPTRLSKYNTEDICEACRRRGAEQADGEPMFRTEEQLYERFRKHSRSEGREALPSDVERQLIAVKRGLVEQLYLQRGPFWEAIRDMRSRWGIAAVANVPTVVGAPGPPECAPKAPEEDGDSQEWAAFVGRWNADLMSIRDRTVPKYSHEGVDWWNFLNTCVLYDPPGTELREFAKRGGIMFGSGVPERLRNAARLPIMARPPIELLADPKQVEALERWRWIRLVGELQERYLKPLGLDVWKMLDDIEKNPPPGFVEEYLKRLDQLDDNRQVYIEVGEQSTKEDIEKASRLARAAVHKNRPSPSRPKRDRLTCIECAILKDQHGWSDEKLAGRYGWSQLSTVGKYVRAGRAIIRGE